MIRTSKGMTSDSLSIHPMHALLLKTWEVKFLRFKNAMNFEKAKIKVYDMQRSKEKCNEISQNFLYEIKQYKK